MKTMTVSQLLNVISGELVKGSEQIEICHGAYRLEQVKKPNTVLFLRKRMVDWSRLRKFFPLIVVAEHFDDNLEDENDLSMIKVPNIEDAYWQFIFFYRSQFKLPIVAVTGTSGKTTTKEMIKHILSSKLNVQTTIASNNSRTAHMDYLLGIDDSTQTAVFETAVGQPGNISLACQYYQPTMGIITNIGSHHLNKCITEENYIKAKEELIHSLTDNGVLFLNIDDKNTKTLDLTNFSGKVITFGLAKHAQFQADHIRYSGSGMEYTLKAENTEYSVYVPGFGEHQVYNSLAALAVSSEIGVPLPEAINQLASFKNLRRHIELRKGINGATILDDTWSITSTSLESAVKVLNGIANGRTKILVVGSMTDLGAWGYRMHTEIGKIICQYPVDILITIGHLAAKTGSYVAEQETNCEVHMFDIQSNDKGYSQAYNLLVNRLDKDSLVLLKGDMLSKGMLMLADKLKEKRLV